MRSKIYRFSKLLVFTVFFTIFLNACEDDTSEPKVNDPDKAEMVSIDRFSDIAGTLMKRSENSALPEINEPINFDQSDFITQSYGPDGQVVRYYNFDVQSLSPAPIYVLFKEGSVDPVEGQLNIINVIPGDIGYNDFWVVYEVMVPENYQANSASSYQDLIDAGYSISKKSALVNCPVVPYGSTADLRYGNESSTLDRGWYKKQVVYYFNFMEKDMDVNQVGLTPISPIYVTFNINPDASNPNSGPPSGFVIEPGTVQTHNVIATVPSDIDYSPLWSVYVYDNADFDAVDNLSTAQAANILAEGVMYVNCPVVYVD